MGVGGDENAGQIGCGGDILCVGVSGGVEPEATLERARWSKVGAMQRVRMRRISFDVAVPAPTHTYTRKHALSQGTG